MDWLIWVGVAAIAIVALSIASRSAARRSARGSGTVGAGMFGVVDEVFAPSRHEAVLEMDRQSALPAPAPLPGDGDLGIYEGRIRIRLGTDGTAGR